MDETFSDARLITVSDGEKGGAQLGVRDSKLDQSLRINSDFLSVQFPSAGGTSFLDVFNLDIHALSELRAIFSSPPLA